MTEMLPLAKYSIGIGDRFGLEAQAQLRACMLALDRGVRVVPVWNKSNREHVIIGSQPASTRLAADAAVKALAWAHPYHIDADHVRLDTVDRFLTDSDYYTLDVGDAIGRPISNDLLIKFVDRHPELLAPVPGIAQPLKPTQSDLLQVVKRYLPAVMEAAAIYRHILSARGQSAFITEISMDETEEPQSPWELMVILAALADEGVPLQAIAPKFIGRFNKGIDYAGDVDLFAKQFRDALGVIAFAARQYDLPATLKLSVHSGSDKFSLYQPMREALIEFGAGLHLKTAGTTWLEELIGLAEADASGCSIVRNIYFEARHRIDELSAPYGSVINIDPAELPAPVVVQNWNSEQLVAALSHDSLNPSYNPHMRQLLHVAYKIAAEMGGSYLDAVRQREALIAGRVTANLYGRHLKPLFPGAG
jgi:hypothetical protein